ncbi:MAG: UDP-N-acetylmuramate:L-alanyl-gamma-D-glutamyl-meso-diaminopimelate ligase [Candidatus Endonucleobacter bathymodioli]|uniref:UDP-N-acetylmuramate--L-alanyl-gamma-D-glutamyl-meso-2,6-diaminoheptandioate ligase n=1 Tax=Candidatus Endonucleibacter bathymodioli TaxID=539814 RepID=A0AA90SUI5_9GAMM|nr:UDP-N-acetylmuramate:L-alanyl-gamma-D-glutamyl-meso-diaminopimelate ligase [Candidatus Endonucleobacter bathymodioli]
MHIHVLGICGTFMGSLAILAREHGFKVSGSDQHVYPPMSSQLESVGIELMEGYVEAHLEPKPDLVVIGNALSRGNPAVEYILDKGLSYTSGAEFFASYLSKDKWVLAVSGTHGKTTVSSMLAWILEYAGMSPGFLIGGVPSNFGVSARSGDTPFFVVEADEYDTAFFDKRSKFVHYRPRTLVINNLEFDHADIFEDLAAIQKQFHHLIRTVPSSGRIILPDGEQNIDQVLDMGCWSETEVLGKQWQARALKDDGSTFEVLKSGKTYGCITWGEIGSHNIANAMAAIAAARHVGVLPGVACDALSEFQGVKRRMELVAEIRGIKIYDDFAHHPTAIATTLEGFRAKVGNKPIRLVIEPRSNTMKMGVHKQALFDSIQSASEVIWFQSDGLKWSLEELIQGSSVPSKLLNTTEAIVCYLKDTAKAGENILIMSNGGFEGIHARIVQALESDKT